MITEKGQIIANINRLNNEGKQALATAIYLTAKEGKIYADIVKYDENIANEVEKGFSIIQAALLKFVGLMMCEISD